MVNYLINKWNQPIYSCTNIINPDCLTESIKILVYFWQTMVMFKAINNQKLPKFFERFQYHMFI